MDLASASAGGTPGYLGPVVVFLAVAALIGYLSARVRVVPIVGFLLAGVLIGPHQLRLVQSTEVVQAAADIGVILLLFTIGIEFSLERLAGIRRQVLLGGGLQVALAIGVTAGLCTVLGLRWNDALFTGFLVALSSTAIVLKVLAATGRTQEPSGQATVALLIFQDLAVVAMVLLVPLLGAGAGGQDGAWALLRSLGIALVVIAVVLLVARHVMPPLLERVARTCSPEVFLLTVVAIGLGTAWFTSLAGVSVSLGAFLAGLVVSESRHSAHVLGEVLPLQILFSATFFVSIGMLLDVRFLMSNLWLVAGTALAVVAVKTATTTAALLALRFRLASAFSVGLLLAQIGEFSFVLQQTGNAEGLSPAGLGPDGAQVLIAVTVLLMAATPALNALGGAITTRVVRPMHPVATTAAEASETPGRDLVLISGWGPVAQGAAAVLRHRKVSLVVLTLSPDLAADAEAQGHTVVRGDSTRQHVLHEAGIERARMMIIAEDVAEHASRIAGVVRTLTPDVTVVVRPVDAAEPAFLARAGADRVVDGTRAAAERLVAAVLRDIGVATEAQNYPDPTLLVEYQPDPASACPHVSEIVPVLPATAGCTGCLQEGRHDWVHLRICLSCGYVGCCDSSPQRHASTHGRAKQHPIMCSAEPDDDWAWCYLDSTTMQPRSAIEA